MKLNKHEMLALYLAARLLSRHSDEHNPHVVGALEKLADALTLKAPMMAQHIVQAANAVRGRRLRREYVEAFEAITQGWAQGRMLQFRYRSYSKDEMTERMFAPYFIEPSGIGYACYAIGYDDLSQDMRTFKIERMYEVRLTDKTLSLIHI